jgi:hypothetical protein
MDNIINPDKQNFCNVMSDPIQVFILDVVANEFVIVSSPLKDTVNCIEFGADLYSIVSEGSNILNPGMSSTFKIIIE